MGDTPSSIRSREQFARALAALREERSLTVRQVVERSGGSLATVGGWYSGRHVPTPQNSQAFFALLAACGVEDDAEQARWWDAVLRVRKLSARRPDETPYKGLDSFEPEDAEWFFGRDHIAADLRARVEAALDGDSPQVIVVTGASGSGKSSLLRAGLVAALEVEATITRPSLPIPTDGAPVVIVDQAEELWSPGFDADARTEYLRRIATSPVVVVGLRADFYAAALAEPVLLRALSAGPLVVGPMSADDMREAITGPARQAGATVDETLVTMLLDDLVPAGSSFAAEPGILPLLSHALLGTWQRAKTPTLTVADYRATGGIGGAVQQSAEEVFGAMSPAEQGRVRRVLLRLVTIDGDTVTRRRMPLDELAGEGSDLALLQRFASARLLTVDEDVVQVTHEALLAVWTRLREWIDADRAWFVNHRLLTQAAGVWVESGRDTSALLGASRLGFYDELLAIGDRAEHLNSVEREFLSDSRIRLLQNADVERRRARTRRRLVAALAAATVVAVVLAATALVARSAAVEERAAADAARAQAESRQIVTTALSIREREPNVSAQLALAAYRSSPTLEARSALLDSTGTNVPTRILGPSGTTVVAATADGSLLCIGYASGDVSIRGGEPANPEVGRANVGGEIYAAAFDPSAKVAAVGGDFGVVLLDVSDPTRTVRTIDLPTDGTTVYDLIFAPSGDQLMAGGAGGRILRWAVTDSRSAVTLPSLELPSGGDTHIAISDDGRFLAAAGSARSLRVWDIDRGALESPVVDRRADESRVDYLDIAFSPNGRMLAAGNTDRTVSRWTVDETGSIEDDVGLNGFESYVNAVDFSADGTRIAAGSSDNSARVWDAQNGQPVATLPGSAIVGAITFGRDSSTVVTSDAAGTTRTWDVPGPVLLGAGDTLYTNPSDASGRILVGGIGSRGQGSMLWDVRNPESVIRSATTLTSADDSPTSGASAVSADGRLAAVGTSGGGFQLWDVADPLAPVMLTGTASAFPSTIGGIAFDRTSSVVALTSIDVPGAQLWDIRGTQTRKLAEFDVEGLPQVIAFDPAADVLAVTTSSSGLELFDTSDASSPTRITTVPGFGSGGAQAAAFSPDGSTLAVGTADRTAKLFDVSDVFRVQQLSVMSLSAAVMSVTFDSSGKALATGIGTDALWLWDVSDRTAPRPHAQLTASGGRVNDAAFLDGGKYVSGGGAGGTVHLWRTDPDAVATSLCTLLGSPLTQDEWTQYLPGLEYRTLC